MLYTILILVAVIGIGAAIVLNLPSFGKVPSGKRLARIEQSPNDFTQVYLANYVRFLLPRCERPIS